MDNPIRKVKGVGEKTEQLFHKLGIFTEADLLNFYPRTYDIFKPVTPIQSVMAGEVHTVAGKITENLKSKKIRNLTITTAKIKDDSGVMELTWFNMPFLQKTLRTGFYLVLRGRVVRKGTLLSMEQPVMYKKEEYDKLVNVFQPVYSLTAGLSNKLITKIMRDLLSKRVEQKDFIPTAVKKKHGLADINYAITNIHFPKSFDDLKKARERLVFNEFFTFITMLAIRKDNTKNLPNPYKITSASAVDSLMASLPFKLTDAQNKALAEIRKDLQSPYLMNRLVQGDVGSGKTILAILALYEVAMSGYQGALMAPTEVLAKQHYESITELFERHNIKLNIILLTGSMTAKEKRLAYEKIEAHEADIIIGTHALFQDKVKYDKLALVITDEQHRFGVRQRETLMKKGGDNSEDNAHVLVMSATPIPRTLAIILYGDLDISMINELPANRLPIKNCVVDTSYRPNAYRFIENEVRRGHQCYIICPMVEENEEIEAESVEKYTTELKEVFPADIRIEYLHGKMNPKEKNLIMEQFAQNQIQVLVSTTVIEVGINVPNSTVMMVENAERFGLAQLHQLRGRVGRGKAQSYCIFINSSDKPEAKERLDILAKSNDGFYIAEEDLKLRGPGDLLGVRQSGDMIFQIADIFADAKLLKEASDSAKELVADNPSLEGEEYIELKRYVDRLAEKHLSTLNI